MILVHDGFLPLCAQGIKETYNFINFFIFSFLIASYSACGDPFSSCYACRYICFLKTDTAPTDGLGMW